MKPNLPTSLTTVTTFSKILAGIIFITLPFIGFALGMQYQALLSSSTQTPVGAVNNTPVNDNDPAVATAEPSVNYTPTQKINADPNVKTYTSQKLGVTFDYLEKQDGQTITVKENGGKICVTYDPSDNNCDKGQSVEVFQKGENEALDAAIKRMFLGGKDPAKCFVTITNPTGYTSNFVQGEITYPEGSEVDLEKMSESTEYCSAGYARTNGIRYFLEDKTHPSKFLFFSIGQYAINAEEGKTWQETIIII